MSTPRIWAWLCLTGSMVLVGCYVAFAKLIVVVFPVFLLAWIRFGIAAVAMIPWTARKPDELPLTNHDRFLLFLESFFGNFLFSICMLFGMAHTSALAAGVIMAGIPAAVAVASRIILRERVAARTAAGIACAVSGIALVSLSGRSGVGTHWLGNALVFGSMVCEAIYVVIGKKLAGRVRATRISAIMNLWGMALVTPFGVYQALSFDFTSAPLQAWMLLVFYALAASVFTVWLWMTGLRDIDASVAGVFTVFLPVTAAAIGVLFFKEQFGVEQAAAFALALAGVALATWPAGRGPIDTIKPA